jgi:hypothetical protein
MDIPHETGDHKYERGSAEVTGNVFILLFVTHGEVDDTEHGPILAILEELNAISVGTWAFMVRTELSAASLVEMFRKFFIGQEYVYALSVCGELEWAGPRFVRKFFDACGIRIQHSEEIPNPVDPRL